VFQLKFDVDHSYIQPDLRAGFTDLRIFKTHLAFRPKLQEDKRVVIEFKDIESVDIHFGGCLAMASVYIKALRVSSRSNYFPLPCGWDYL